MALINVVVILIVVGVLLMICNRYLAEYIAPPILKIINAVVVIAVILWLLKVFGLWGGLSTVSVGR